jgi:hypothetical protein
MTISSAQLDCLTISSDTVTIDTSTWNMSSGTGSSYYHTAGAGSGGFSSDTITISNGGFTIGGAGIGTIGPTSNLTISGLDATQFNWDLNEEFVNCLPNFDRVQKMCKEYPGLKIAYDKFVTTYKLVKDHYDTPEDQRPKP